MKLLDHILVIRHAIIVACKPSAETVMICVHDKNSKKKIVYNFFGDFEKSELLLIDDLGYTELVNCIPHKLPGMSTNMGNKVLYGQYLYKKHE